jgi:hypothetical protein
MDRSKCAASCSAPLTDCSVLAAWLAVPVYGSLRTLTLCSRVRAVDCSAPSLEFRTARRLLCVRYLTFRPARGLLRVLSSTPCVARGSLRAQHLEFPVYLGSLRLRLSLRPVPGLLLVRHLALCSTYGLLRTFHSVPCVGRGLLRSLHLLLRAGTFWYSLLNPTSEAVQVYLATRNEDNYALHPLVVSTWIEGIFLCKTNRFSGKLVA